MSVSRNETVLLVSGCLAVWEDMRCSKYVMSSRCPVYTASCMRGQCVRSNYSGCRPLHLPLYGHHPF